ncbi:MAG TPA: hypothetical protein VL171_12560 [Verrucomicrobiae bacterium]|nr:hypothetical protein [Verrucomicrobiae bacterium]
MQSHPRQRDLLFKLVQPLVVYLLSDCLGIDECINQLFPLVVQLPEFSLIPGQHADCGIALVLPLVENDLSE